MKYPEGFTNCECKFFEKIIGNSLARNCTLGICQIAYNYMFNTDLSEAEFTDRFNDYCSQLNQLNETEDDLLDQFIDDVKSFGIEKYPVCASFFELLSEDDASLLVRGIISEYQKNFKEKSDKIQDEISPTVSSFTNFTDSFQKMIKEFINE